MNIYIIHSSLRRFPITSKYQPMSLMKIETHNPFIYIVFHIISMHSMKITEVHIFPTGNFFFGYIIALVSHGSLNDRICYLQHKLSYS